jgi:uncharacterized damage-inducible protein DinB
MDNTQLALLLNQLALAFDKRSWHGPNLLGSLRGVDFETAGWRPQPGRHNIHEIAVHCAYWKYRVCRLLSPAVARSFTLKGSDWFPRPAGSGPEQWQSDVALLKDWHRQLLDCVSNTAPETLGRPAGPGEFTVSELISGAASHDLYHAGQIRLILRMMRS